MKLLWFLFRNFVLRRYLKKCVENLTIGETPQGELDYVKFADMIAWNKTNKEKATFKKHNTNAKKQTANKAKHQEGPKRILTQ